MYELIKDNLWAYILTTVLTGAWIVLTICGILSRCTTNNKPKAILRFCLCGVLTCLWGWYFIYVNLYPISLAYYEINHELTEEKIGVVDVVEQSGKDRVHLIIDDIEYTMVYSSARPYFIVGVDIKDGDTVKIKFGTSSKYIFDIDKADAI